MKHFYSIILAVFCIAVGYGQFSLHRDTDGSNLPVKPTGQAPDPGHYTDRVFNVYYHVLAGEENGVTYPVSNSQGVVDEFQVMQSIRDLNKAYNPFRIFFKFKGLNVIINDSYVELRLDDYPDTNIPTINQMHEYSVSNELRNGQSINIFIVNKIHAGSTNPIALPGKYWNYYIPELGFSMPDVFVMAEYFKPVTVHEIGHLFGLDHTNQYGVNLAGEYSPLSENVTRVLGLNYNANVAGDKLHDTPASPAEYPIGAVVGGVYVGTQVDATLEPYGTTVPITNYMNVNRDEDIHYQKELTVQQGMVARSYVDSDDPLTIAYYNAFSNTVESLYMPYHVEYVPGAVVSVDDVDNEPGMALVCRAALLEHRFQMGFNYTFPDCNAPDPEDTTTLDVIPVVKYRTTDFKVHVAQVNNDPSALYNIEVICTKNKLCAQEEYTGGHLYSMQVLGSMNITVEELNQVQVSDPNLYENLMAQYYYILKKMTESGEIKEEFFYKP